MDVHKFVCMQQNIKNSKSSPLTRPDIGTTSDNQI